MKRNQSDFTVTNLPTKHPVTIKVNGVGHDDFTVYNDGTMKVRYVMDSDEMEFVISTGYKGDGVKDTFVPITLQSSITKQRFNLFIYAYVFIYMYINTHGWKTYRMENFIYINDKYNLKNNLYIFFILDVKKEKSEIFATHGNSHLIVRTNFQNIFANNEMKILPRIMFSLLSQ